MTLVLAIDTATRFTSVGLLRGDRLLGEVAVDGAGRHGEVLLPRVAELLSVAGCAYADLELLAVGTGPGSFTGLRVGLAFAKGLALACQLPVVGVPTTEVLAFAHGGATVVTCLDAYKGEVYAAAYRARDGELDVVFAPFHAAPERAAAAVSERLGAALASGGEDVAIVGEGARMYPVFTAALGHESGRAAAPGFDVPRASALAALARGRWAAVGADDLAELEPVHLRASDAKLPSTPLRLA